MTAGFHIDVRQVGARWLVTAAGDAGRASQAVDSLQGASEAAGELLAALQTAQDFPWSASRSRRPFTEAQDRVIIDHWGDGTMAIPDIAQRCGRSEPAVYFRARRKLSLPPRRAPKETAHDHAA
jgi:hypothetical protein